MKLAVVYTLVSNAMPNINVGNMCEIIPEFQVLLKFLNLFAFLEIIAKILLEISCYFLFDIMWSEDVRE